MNHESAVIIRALNIFPQLQENFAHFPVGSLMKAAIENMAADKPCCVHALDHISRLPDADKARQQLEELKRHIDPILRARGLRVLKCYEICCCTSGGKNLSVGGFCSPAGDKRTSLCIALRLRQPRHDR